MSRDKDNRIEPVCKFGPGGDFVSFWPPESSPDARHSPGSLADLLGTISELMNAMLGTNRRSGLPGFSSASTNTYHPTGETFCLKEKLEYAVKNSKAENDAGSAHPATDAVIKSNRLLSTEPMLFADACGAGLRIGHKPKHRIRTYRRTSKKRPAFGLPGQGSLFETDFESAKSA